MHQQNANADGLRGARCPEHRVAKQPVAMPDRGSLASTATREKRRRDRMASTTWASDFGGPDVTADPFAEAAQALSHDGHLELVRSQLKVRVDGRVAQGKVHGHCQLSFGPLKDSHRITAGVRGGVEQPVDV